jgi:GNAT superfamily N-acetyltransferase
MTAVIVNTTGHEWFVDHPGSDDRPRLDRLFGACSPDTVYQRFFGRLNALPPGYVHELLAGPPDLHDAVLVRCGGGQEVVGLASLAAGSDAGPGIADLGVLVADAGQRRGMGTAMIGALLARARSRGIERISASVLPQRPQLLAALARRVELERVCREPDCLTGIYRLR